MGIRVDKNQQGFTLTELLVTIAVMAIIATMAAPSFSNLIASQRLNSTTRELVSTLTQARSQAVLLRREITVTLNSASTNTSTNFYWNPKANNTLNVSPSIPPIVFTASGTLKDTAANTPFADTSFVICNSTVEKTKTINLSRMGSTNLGGDGTC